ncbi:MAG: LamG-like jellyroll fold domain-containing protein [Candidatus Thorarchaeota archaeon]|jgi:hypothetical protein
MARDFDAASKYISFAHNSDLNAQSQFTVCAWYKPKGAVGGEWGRLFAKEASGGTYGMWALGIDVVENTLYWKVEFDGANAWVETSTTFWESDYDEWVFIIAEKNGYDVNLWTWRSAAAGDGWETHTADEVTGSGNLETDTGSLRIGALSSGNRYMNGHIANCAIWHRTLTEGERRMARQNPLLVSGIKFFCPILGRGGEHDIVGGLTGTLGGSPTIVDHPPVSPIFGYDEHLQAGWTVRKKRGGINYPGTNGNYLSLPHSTNYNFAGASAWTVLAFIRCDDLTADDRTFIGKYEGTERQFFLRSNKLGQVQVWNGGVNRYNSSTGMVTLGKWYLVSVRHAASSSNFEVDLFELDGTQIIDSGAGSGFSDEGANTKDVHIGAWGTGTEDNMDGPIAFPCYISEVLSDNDLLSFLHHPALTAARFGANLRFLLDGEVDVSGNNVAVTETGTLTKGDGPPISPIFGFDQPPRTGPRKRLEATPFDRAMLFTESLSNYVSLGNAYSFSIAADWSVQLFFKNTDTAAQHGIISKWGSAANTKQLRAAITTSGYLKVDYNTTSDTGTVALSDDTWYVLTLVHDAGTDWSWWVHNLSGTLVDSSTGLTEPADVADLTYAVVIGCEGLGLADPHEGAISMVAIYDVLLAATHGVVYTENPYQMWETVGTDLTVLAWGDPIIDRSGNDGTVTVTGTVNLGTDPVLPIHSKRAMDYPGTTGNYVSFADVSTARYPHAGAWTALAFAKFDNFASDERTVLAKWQSSKQQFAIRTDTSGNLDLLHNAATRYTGSNALSIDTWYLIAVTHKADGNGTVSVFTLDGSAVSGLDADSWTTASDNADLTAGNEIGGNSAGTADMMDGLVQFVSYFGRELSRQDVLAYLDNPFELIARQPAEFFICEDKDLSGNDLTVTENGTVTRDYDPIRVSNIPLNHNVILEYLCDEMTGTTVANNSNFASTENLDLTAGQTLGSIGSAENVRWSADLEGGGVYGTGLQVNPRECSAEPTDFIDYMQALSPAKCSLETVTRLDGDDDGPPRVCGVINDSGVMVFTFCAHETNASWQYRMRTSGGGNDSLLGNPALYSLDGSVFHVAHILDMDITGDEAIPRVNGVADYTFNNPAGDFSDWAQDGATRLGMMCERGGGVSRAYEGLIYWWRLYDRALSPVECAWDTYAGADPCGTAEVSEEGPSVFYKSIAGAQALAAAIYKKIKFIIKHPSPGQ